MTFELAGIFGYILLQLLIGTLLVRGIKSESDYFLAGRSFGPVLAMVSVFATWFGAETCIGSAGEAYNSGLTGGRIDPFGYTICLLLAGLILAAPLWRGGYITLADLYRKRFGIAVEKLAAIILIPTSLLWAAAQIRAFGQILAASSDITVTTAMAIAAVAVTAYTVVGGLRADVITDLVQGIFIVIGLGVLVGVVLYQFGGIGKVAETIDPARLNLIASDESFLTQLDIWLVPILGSFVSQELASRVMSSRSAAVARRATLTAALVYLIVGSIPLFLGLIGPHLISGVEHHEQFLATLAHQYLATPLYIVFAGALVSAILSTVDSALLAVGSLAAHNLVAPALKITDERRKVRIARICVLITGIAAFGFALTSEGIRELVEAASSFGTGGIVVITLFGLFSKWGGKVAAFAALAGGVSTLLVAEHVIGFEAPFAASIAVALGCFLLGWGIERQTESTS